MRHTTLAHIHPDAPPQPALGAPCNGCGLCCLLEPCPLGMVLSRKRIGARVALRWSEAQQRYLCGAISDAPTGRLGQLRQWLARRWIAAGVGVMRPWWRSLGRKDKKRAAAATLSTVRVRVVQPLRRCPHSPQKISSWPTVCWHCGQVAVAADAGGRLVLGAGSARRVGSWGAHLAGQLVLRLLRRPTGQQQPVARLALQPTLRPLVLCLGLGLGLGLGLLCGERPARPRRWRARSLASSAIWRAFSWACSAARRAFLGLRGRGVSFRPGRHSGRFRYRRYPARRWPRDRPGSPPSGPLASSR